MIKKNAVVEKSIEFAIRIVEFCEVLEERRKYVVATQLLKAGTSIGANIHEAQNAESKADFIHKMKIAVKELEEAKYWLVICERSKSYPYEIHLKESIDELGLILYKIISTAKRHSR
ncbi:MULTISPECIES: four helix bundle protein [unclassified Arenibacter]|jgi:four helix bundle protein|uniref:four helix bundle protein n=1 Tax=unclassified Arenibacter TaxID=2615047 RepID=UPI000E352FD2|nr:MULTISPECIES: four helix bundle protein [unclassified Arenibacter]MCM4162019.1 four helix bundle protein [Arenibacter sp. A80]RFT57644.1 four helix bundle protein [Arenibacter sp. P308M17]